MHAIYELKEMLCKELEEYGEKQELTAGSLDVVDKLAHTIKNLDKIIETYEEEGYSEEGGGGGQSYERGGGGGRGGSYARGGRGGGRYSREGMGGGSYARGRTGNVRRDSMGRYSRYSMDNDEMVQELRTLMEDAPDDRTRKEFQRFIQKIEQM